MIQSFIDGLMNYQFLQYALVTSMLVGLASGVIGSFIILRGMSLMGDAISHAVLPGVAISYMFGFSYIFGATAFGMLTAAVIGDHLDFICSKCDRPVSYFIWECLSC